MKLPIMSFIVICGVPMRIDSSSPNYLYEVKRNFKDMKTLIGQVNNSTGSIN